MHVFLANPLRQGRNVHQMERLVPEDEDGNSDSFDHFPCVFKGLGWGGGVGAGGRGTLGITLCILNLKNGIDMPYRPWERDSCHFFLV